MVWPYNEAPPRPTWASGTAREPVQHYSYIDVRYPYEDLSHHTMRADTKPGAHACGICGRWVVRGMGRWWEQAR